MRVFRLAGVLALVVAVARGMPSVPEKGDAGDECRLPRQAVAHWRRPLATAGGSRLTVNTPIPVLRLPP